jgi:transcriptional regulator with GAF, ATPase, and Fis domain
MEGFEGIIGKSHLLLNVFDHVSQVAATDTSVLLLGESGTGKEKIADCIHNLSTRKGQPFIKVNCATLPSTLIESELFGHEKGSFTGANEKRIGKFEKADKGTIFLDEIGEMPIELQVKLLRVLQEKEIEPIGSNAPVKINVRIIAATNRNWKKK